METPQAKLPRPTVHISPITNTDIPTIARLFLLAFQTSEYSQALTPHRVGLSTSELLAQEGPSEERRFRRWLVGRNAVFMKASLLIADNDGNKVETIVGWARWEAPPGFRRRSIWEWLWSEVFYPLEKIISRPRISRGFPDAARTLVIAQEADTFGPGGIAEGRKHWHLHILCVDPAWQGRGIGGALLEWGTDKAKDTDSAVYLESTPVGRPFYIAKGFRVTSDRPGEVNGIRISVPGMIWEPRTLH